ncbi:hypothetical protein [Ruminococcus flavefaciens]|uniref:hypothetical protein n=1 Tax=Ruminococcus flavefaciens TaxID=1265 RepID=UPI00048BFF61|nr:hypothetical protein [Ruminococcus flavefaciens]
MDGTALMIYLTLLFVGAVCGALWLILLIIGCVKKNKKRIVLSFIPLGVFALIAGSIFAYDAVKTHNFNNIPCLEVKKDTVTILNNGTGSMGSKSNYVLAEEDENGNIIVRSTERSTIKYKGSVFVPANDSILTETDQPYYHSHIHEKFGYTFKANKTGTAYVCILESDCGSPAYLDIYKITVDNEKNAAADNIRHINCDNNFRNELPKEFSFLMEAFDELNIK